MVYKAVGDRRCSCSFLWESDAVAHTNNASEIYKMFSTVSALAASGRSSSACGNGYAYLVDNAIETAASSIASMPAIGWSRFPRQYGSVVLFSYAQSADLRELNVRRYNTHI